MADVLSMSKYVFPGADASLPLGWVISQVCHLLKSKTFMNLVAREGKFRDQVCRCSRCPLLCHAVSMVSQLGFQQGHCNRPVRRQVVPDMGFLPGLLRHVSISSLSIEYFFSCSMGGCQLSNRNFQHFTVSETL